MSDPCLIIAEAGVNHAGSLELAFGLVEAAADAGADAVKFQAFSADALAGTGAAKAEYQRRTTGEDGSQLEMLRSLELDEEAHVALARRAGERGIIFLSSPFDLCSIEMLERVGIGTYKVPSGQITDLPYLRRIGGLGKPVIVSTGMATLEEVGAALEALEEAGTPRGCVTLLQCTTEYPAPVEDVNLRAMGTMRAAFGTRVGYSDHTLGMRVPLAAVALGASVLEKHFTLDRSLQGPDHAASLEPVELAELVRCVRDVETALGDGVKRPSPRELANAEAARKSIVAARLIPRGEPMTADALTTKRPGTGVSPMRWDEAVGQPALRDFAEGELIEL
jgi:N,N'-diacetyllegionaminate synthase